MEYTLVELAEALEQLDRIEVYLGGETYTGRVESSFGTLSLDWRKWYLLVQDGVSIVRAGQDEVREQIAKRIGAKLLYSGLYLKGHQRPEGLHVEETL